MKHLSTAFLVISLIAWFVFGMRFAMMLVK